MQAIEGPRWEGWVIDNDGYLCDPAGNKYLPQDLYASFWGRQAWAARAGYPGEIKFLRERLAELIRDASPPVFIVEIKRQGKAGSDPVIVQTFRLKG